MDYDKTQMPAGYDAGRGYDAETMVRWLAALSPHLPRGEIRDIVDLGCGTGRFSAALAEHFQAKVIGLEPSEKMLAQARSKPTTAEVAFLQGAGEAMPLEDRSADLLFLSMVYHHFSDPQAVARECHRVLRPTGFLCLRNSTQEHFGSYPNKEFFPGIETILQRRLPSGARIKAVFKEAGFALVAAQVVSHQMAPSWAEHAEKMAHRAESFLAELPDHAFQTGMSRLRHHAEVADPGEPVMVDIDLLVFQAG